MPQVVKHIRSAVAGKVPSTSDLELGVVAINTYDGKLFLKKSQSGIESIVELAAAAPGGEGSGANQADYGLVNEGINSTADYGSIA